MANAGERIPILIGAAAVQQKIEDPNEAREALDLMQAALEGAADDAGARDLLARASSIRAPRGFWPYPDPCRVLAQRFGADHARTTIAEIGVLQTTLFGGAARDIASGKDDIVLITGGEARYRTRWASKRGIEETNFTQDAAVTANETLRPTKDVLHDLELERGLGMPVNQYSMIENALRASEGVSIEAHRTQVANLYAGLSAIAADNDAAWSRERLSAELIRGSTDNPMLAFPYTKLHTSQWNVDQAAGFILTTPEIAARHGIDESRWIYPHAVVESNLMLALSERREPHRCVGFTKAAERVEQTTGRSVADASYLELYSCFPAAVRLQVREMNLDNGRPVSVTGGMAYAGGPLNNFSFQALAKMSTLLRENRESSGVVTAVSGILTKQGVSMWSCNRPRAPFHYGDVSEATAGESPSVEVVPNATGDGAIVTYTVLYPGGEAVLVCLVHFDNDTRTIVASGDPHLAALATTEELCGRRAKVHAADTFEVI